PLQPGHPDSGVLGPPPEARFEQGLGLGKSTGTGREVRQSQPDAVVSRRPFRRTRERALVLLDGYGEEALHDVRAEDIECLGGPGRVLPDQGAPVGLEEPDRLVAASLAPEE